MGRVALSGLNAKVMGGGEGCVLSIREILSLTR